MAGNGVVEFEKESVRDVDVVADLKVENLEKMAKEERPDGSYEFVGDGTESDVVDPVGNGHNHDHDRVGADCGNSDMEVLGGSGEEKKFDVVELSRDVSTLEVVGAKKEVLEKAFSEVSVIVESNDSEESSMEMIADVKCDGQTDANLGEVCVAEDMEDCNTIVTEVLVVEHVISNSNGHCGVEENSGDLSSEPDQEESERGNLSEEHCGTVSMTCTNDCVESEVVVSNAYLESYETISCNLSGTEVHENGNVSDNELKVLSVDNDTELENEVSDSHMMSGAEVHENGNVSDSDLKVLSVDNHTALENEISDLQMMSSAEVHENGHVNDNDLKILSVDNDIELENEVSDSQMMVGAEVHENGNVSDNDLKVLSVDNDTALENEVSDSQMMSAAEVHEIGNVNDNDLKVLSVDNDTALENEVSDSQMMSAAEVHENGNVSDNDLKVLSIDNDTELENEVSDSQMMSGACCEKSENDSVNGKTDVVDEKDFDCEVSIKAIKIAENISTVQADKIDSENRVQIVHCEDKVPVSCSADKVFLRFLARDKTITQWGSLDVVLVDSEILMSSSLDVEQEQQTEDAKVRIETSKDSDAERLEIVNKDSDSSHGSSHNEIIPSVSEGVVSPSLPGQIAVSAPNRFYIIRNPKFFDPELLKQKEDLELQVDERTKSRDSLQSIINSKKVTCDKYSKELDAAKLEDKAARGLFNSKRQEIDAIQNTFNMMKTAISFDGINNQINSLEHRIKHETNTLKEEKQLIRDIDACKQARDRISSTLGSRAEVKEAFEKQHLIKEQFERLQQDLNSLRGEMLRAEKNVKSIKRKYDDERQALRKLCEQRNSLNDLRQELYLNLQSVKNEYHDKNVHFHGYKYDKKAAYKYSTLGDREALKQHCDNQVEKYMELWNRNDEFRNNYIKCKNTHEPNSVLSTPETRHVKTGESVTPENVLNTVKQKSQAYKPHKSSKLIPQDAQKSQPDKPNTSKIIPQDAPNVIIASSESVMKEVGKKNIKSKEIEKENEQAKEDELARLEEAARQEEELERAEYERKQKVRSEQIAKAKEAKERKMRREQKAKARSELRAKREAELKLKNKANNAIEQEKLKKNKAKNEIAESSISLETVQVPEVKATTASKRPSKKKNKPKPIPLSLRNKGKRGLQTWMWMTPVIAIGVVLFFLGGNYVVASKFNMPDSGV